MLFGGAGGPRRVVLGPPGAPARRNPRTAAAGGVGLLLLAASGCAERQLVTAPASRPGVGTWVAVWVAGALAAGVLGVLLTLPAWRERGGARFAVALLTAQTGVVAVVGILLSSAAVRTWQLLDRAPEAEPARALMRLSRVDGDTALLSLTLLLVVILATALATLLALSAQLARSTHLLERSVACAVLGVQMLGCATAAVAMVLGARGWPFLGATLAFPVVAVAFATCWPTRAHTHRAPI